MVEETFLTKQKFSKLVEQTVHQMNMTYMDAIVHLGEQNQIEMEDIKKYLSPVIKGKVEAEARGLNFLPRENTLPLE